MRLKLPGQEDPDSKEDSAAESSAVNKEPFAGMDPNSVKIPNVLRAKVKCHSTAIDVRFMSAKMGLSGPGVIPRSG